MKFLVMPGDGIGPEIVPVAVAALRALNQKLGLGISLEEVPIGFASLETQGNTFPDEVLEKARDSDGVIMGPTDTLAYPPISDGGRGPSAVATSTTSIVTTSTTSLSTVMPLRRRPLRAAAIMRS